MFLSEAQLILLQEFGRGLDPRQPECSRIPAVVLGYGEISTVIAIQEDALIWMPYLSMCGFDRFLRSRLLRRQYPYILPGKIKR